MRLRVLSENLYSKTLGIALLLLAPFATKAVELPGLDETAAAANLTQGAVDPEQVVATIISQVLGFIGVLFLVLMIWGGFLWMTAAGNDERIKSATKIVTAAVIGLVIVLSAYAITRFIGQNVGPTSI